MFLHSGFDAPVRGALPAGMRDVREAIRELAVHALRSRPLTAEHIACVARTVGEGIANCSLPPAPTALEARHGAWDGLEDAVDWALHAMEVPAGEVAREDATPGERSEIAQVIARLRQASNRAC